MAGSRAVTAAARGLGIIGLLGSVLFSASAADASPTGVTLTVPGEYSSIGSAVAAASNGDVIAVSPGIYRENVDLDGKALTL
jgi:hypothetical protein